MPNPKIKNALLCLLSLPLAIGIASALFVHDATAGDATGSISGRVVRKTEGTGLSGIAMNAYDSGWNYAGFASTDVNGNYSVTGLAAGSYYVKAYGLGNYASQYYSHQYSQSSATAIVVAEGGAVSGIDFEMEIFGSVSGRVERDSDGAGLPYIIVMAYDAYWNIIASGSSDASGDYRIERLVPGAYYIGINTGSEYRSEYFDDAASQSVASAVNVASDTTTSDINFRLSKLGAISGRVTRNSNGTGLYGITVYAFKASGSVAGISITDPNGVYTISKLEPGSYYVNTSAGSLYIDEYYDNAFDKATATFVSVDLDSTTSDINFGLGQGGTISGRVTRDFDGAGVVGILVYAYDAGWNLVKSASTDVNGNYSFIGLFPGSYRLKTLAGSGYIDEYYDNAASQSAATAVSVADDGIASGIDFELQALALGGISGRVVRDVDGAGISGMTIWVYNANWGSVKHATTDAGGYYSVTGLLAGEYFVGTNVAWTYVNEYYDNVTFRESAAAVEVVLNTMTPDINFGCALEGTISGRVTSDSTGSGLPIITIEVFSIDRDLIRTGLTDANGNFKISQLAAGSYFIKASSGSVYASRYYQNSRDHKQAVPVAVLAGADTGGINIGMSKYGALSGRVTRASDGEGIPGVQVKIADGFLGFDVSSSIGAATTDSGGYYQIVNVAPGDYFAKVDDPNYATTIFDNTVHEWNAEVVHVAPETVAPGIDFALAAGGSLSGRVLKEADGTGILNAYVYAYANLMTYRRAITDSQGYYRIAGLPAGEYLVAAHSAEVTDNAFASGYYRNSRSAAGAARVAVADNADTPEINFAFSSGAIEGTILYSACGCETRLAVVSTYDPYWNRLRSTAALISSGETPYSLKGLLPGDYYVGIEVTGYRDLYYGSSTDRNGAVKVTVVPGGTAGNIHFALTAAELDPPAGSISGRVRSAFNGSGIANIYVQAFDGGGNPSGESLTDSHGRYRIEGLPPGSYYLRTNYAYGFVNRHYDDAADFSHATPVSVVQDADTPDIDFALEAGLAVYGIVYDAVGQNTLQGVRINAYDVQWVLAGSAVTDSQGAFCIEELPPGPYYLQTQNSLGYADEYLFRSGSRDDAARLNLTAVDRSVFIGLSKPAARTPDFNGDKKPDLLWRNAASGDIYIWFMNGIARAGGGYLAPAPDRNCRTAAIADFNEDGNPDILCRNAASGENLIWLMNGLTIKGEVRLDPVSDVQWTIAGAADFSKDGQIDILWRNVSTGENYVWFMNRTVQQGGALLAETKDAEWKIAGLGDFNHDNQADILWRNTSTGENSVEFMDGTVRTGEAFLDAVSNLNWRIASASDFDEDGRADILWRNGSTGENYVWFMNGVARTRGEYLESVTDLKWLALDSGGPAVGADFNSDDNPDLLWRNAATGDNYLWVMRGRQMMSGVSLDSVSDPDWKIAGLADFNGDGRVDILWRNCASGDNYLWHMNGNRLTGGKLLAPETDVHWKIVAVADFNGDWKADILWRNDSTGENRIWRMDESTPAGVDDLPSVPDAGRKIAGVADFNRDGHADILWRNESTGENYVWYMNGPAHAGDGYLDSVSDPDWTIACIADFNKDGMADIVWRNKATGENRIWRMNGIVFAGVDYLPTVAGQDWQLAPSGE